MSTDQKYDATASDATASPIIEQPVTTGSASHLYGKGLRPILVADQFGDDMYNPEAMNRLRRDVRSWFMAYVPVQDESYSPNSLAESLVAYQVLDEFLSGLVQTGIDRLEKEVDNA